MDKNAIDIYYNFQLEKFKLRDTSQRHCGCKLQKMAQKNNAKKQPNIQACKGILKVGNDSEKPRIFIHAIMGFMAGNDLFNITPKQILVSQHNLENYMGLPTVI